MGRLLYAVGVNLGVTLITLGPVVIGLVAEIGERSWYSISSCLIWKNSEVTLVEGDVISMDDVDEVGVLGSVEARGIILPKRPQMIGL